MTIKELSAISLDDSPTLVLLNHKKGRAQVPRLVLDLNGREPANEERANWERRSDYEKATVRVPGEQPATINGVTFAGYYGYRRFVGKNGRYRGVCTCALGAACHGWHYDGGYMNRKGERFTSGPIPDGARSTLSALVDILLAKVTPDQCAAADRVAARRAAGRAFAKADEKLGESNAYQKRGRKLQAEALDGIVSAPNDGDGDDGYDPVTGWKD